MLATEASAGQDPSPSPLPADGWVPSTYAVQSTQHQLICVLPALFGAFRMPQSFNEIARLHAALPPSQQSPPAPGYDPANNIILFPERRAQAEAVAAVRNAYTPGAAVQPANGGNVYGLQLGGPAANAHHHQPNLNQVLHQHPQPVPVAGGSSAAAGAQSAAAGAQNGGAAVSAHLMAMKLMLEQQVGEAWSQFIGTWAACSRAYTRHCRGHPAY
jgi:hypothetical protein